MRISEADTEAKDIDVQFGKATLHVTYKPLTYTVREMDALAGSRDAGQIIETMKRLVVAWDLDDKQGNRVPLDHPMDDVMQEDGSGPSGRKRPADDDPLRDVPSHIFTGIIQAVGKDQTPSGEA